ncbi:MAG: amylo-alpha-1,6-glucosidase, partial [Acidobacteriota bacterium]
EGLYHTADATLWFFHAVERYVKVTGDLDALRTLLPTFLDIVRHHLQGTRFGIGVDPSDGLLRQGEAGDQLTWMDAKVDDWVVTPRRGKAVEINALWYTALRLVQHWTEELGTAASDLDLQGHAEQARESFNRRFWCDGVGSISEIFDAEPPWRRQASAESPSRRVARYPAVGHCGIIRAFERRGLCPVR